MLAPVALAERPWRKRLALALWLRRDLASAALLHATSLREAEELAAMRLGPPIAVLPSGVTVPTDAALHADDTEERLCVFIGRLAPIKQLSLLLDAWARIRPAGWRLVIVGPDERGHGAELAARATALGLEASVTFAGVADDAAKWAWYARADLAVLTSRNESFGLAVAEALAAGVPVVATAGVPWPSLRSEDCGWHVADADFSDALAAATAASAATRRAMGARGRALMMRDYAWPAIATRSASCYRWLLSGGPTPSAVIT
jgi:glycosyltransferase involved in cell wall biosynthesis